MLVQLEVSVETMVAGKIAWKAQVPVVLNPAPVPCEFPVDRFDVDLIFPNESETAALVGEPVDSIEDGEIAARERKNRGWRQIAITLGDRGVVLANQFGNVNHLPAISIQSVGATAAGDPFAGALAVEWAAGCALIDAVRFANCAGALAASRDGAQPGMGTRNEIEALL
ncbi:MAG: hypothetical protein GY904_33665 [Planctomycetaceae bacterium]|nr:hypothetical protein [Planctomycetaceae bacterium]